jgi:hypothetical protein
VLRSTSVRQRQKRRGWAKEINVRAVDHIEEDALFRQVFSSAGVQRAAAVNLAAISIPSRIEQAQQLTMRLMCALSVFTASGSRAQS